FLNVVSFEFLLFSLHDALPSPHLPSFPTRRSSDLSRFLTRMRSNGLPNRRCRVCRAGRSSAIRRTKQTIFTSWSRVISVVKIVRSEEHMSELQSRSDLVCRLLLEKKNTTSIIKNQY